MTPADYDTKQKALGLAVFVANSKIDTLKCQYSTAILTDERVAADLLRQHLHQAVDEYLDAQAQLILLIRNQTFGR